MYFRASPTAAPDADNVTGSPLTVPQADGNIKNISDRLAALETTVANGWVGLDPTTPFTLVGSALYEKLTNGMTYGPFQIPQVGWNLTNPTSGVWLPNHQYYKADAFNTGATLYLVLADHMSAATFDANANNGMGQYYYGIALALPAIPPPGGTTGQALLKHSGADFDTYWATVANVITIGSTTITAGGPPVTALAGLSGLGLTAGGTITGGSTVTFAGTGATISNVLNLTFVPGLSTTITGLVNLNFAAGGNIAFTDVGSFLKSASAGVWRLGAADSATPVGQGFVVQNVASGTTDGAGVDLVFTGSQGTGLGAGGRIVFQAAPPDTSSGTGQNALYNAFIIDGDKSARILSHTRSSQPSGYAPLGFYYDDGGTHYDNIGQTSGNIFFNLPNPAPGLRYEFTVAVGQIVLVDPGSGRYITIGGWITTNGANGMLSNVPGSNLVIEAVDAINWMVVSLSGYWEVI